MTGFGQGGNKFEKMAGHDANYLALSGLLDCFRRGASLCANPNTAVTLYANPNTGTLYSNPNTDWKHSVAALVWKHSATERFILLTITTACHCAGAAVILGT